MRWMLRIDDDFDSSHAAGSDAGVSEDLDEMLSELSPGTWSDRRAMSGGSAL